MPFLGRDLEGNLIEFRQQRHDLVVQFHLAVIAIFISGDGGDQSGGSLRIQRSKKVPLETFADQQGPIDAQVGQPASAVGHALTREIKIAKMIEHPRAALEWLPDIRA